MCSIWSLSIPSFNVDFIGMSLYFFVVDFVRSIFQLDNSIQPTVSELKGYGQAFCSQSWSYWLDWLISCRDVLKNYSGKHKYTNDVALKQRCFQVFILSLNLSLIHSLSKSLSYTTLDFLHRHTIGTRIQTERREQLLTFHPVPSNHQRRKR